MPKTSAIDSMLDELAAIRDRELTEDDKTLVRRRLGHRNSVVVARAAGCAAAHSLSDLVPLLVKRFDDFRKDGPRADKGCVAKLAIVKALDRLEHDRVEWFLEASRIVQHEPAYGGSVDTAVQLRRQSLQAMATFPWFAVSRRLVEMLGDPSPIVRTAAVSALSGFEGREAENILLTKAVCGDDSDDVTGLCLRALLAFGTDQNLTLVLDRLTHADDAIKVEAAFAVAESCRDTGLPHLMDAFYDEEELSVRRSILLAISTMRSDEALEFVREQARDRRYADVCREMLEDGDGDWRSE